MMQKRAKHNPSGILIGWVDSSGKPHTKSIGFTTECEDLKYKFALIDAKKDLHLIQLDLLQQEYEAKRLLPSPIITRDLTRNQVRLELEAMKTTIPLISSS